MNLQDDLFGFTSDVPDIADDYREPVEPIAEALAIPCGFMNKANAPCPRLATRAVMIEGIQMVCRGRPLIHCDPACYDGAARKPAATTIEEWP